MMNTAKLTTNGARRLNLPNLADKEVCYDGVEKSADGLAAFANKLYHNDEYIGACLAFTGDTPGLIDADEAWKHL